MPLISRLIEKGYLKPTLESEQALNSLIGLNGEVLADAMLIIKHKKIAIDPATVDDKRIFEDYGYSIMTIDETKDLIL